MGKDWSGSSCCLFHDITLAFASKNCKKLQKKIHDNKDLRL